jgi:hypothetical protein
MKKIIWILFFFLFGCQTKPDNLNFYGNTSYTKQKSESLNTELNATYKYKLYEAKRDEWQPYIEGKVTTDYDHFQTETKHNVFTTFGLEF